MMGETATATWTLELWAECPHCKKRVDLATQVEGGPDDCEIDFRAKCPNCSKGFLAVIE